MRNKLLIALGALDVMFPEEMATLVGKLCFETDGELRPRDWAVRNTQLQGVALIALGVVGTLTAKKFGEDTDPEEAVEEALDDSVEEMDEREG